MPEGEENRLSLYQTLNQSLEPVLGERTRMVLEEGVRRLGVSPDQLDPSQAEVILKRLVYRELQSRMSPTAARARIEEMLREIGATEKEEEGPNGATTAHSEAALGELEAGLKRFSLYLDWPEVGRLRGLIALIRGNPPSSTAAGLLREGQEVLSNLEERLQSALLRQSRDIADLQTALERVRSVGGPKVRRLENLLRQIQEAHTAETLAPAEVERARALAAEMRKLVESSVVQNPTLEGAILLEEETLSGSGPPTVEMAWDDSELVLDLDFESLTAEQQSRIREIDVAEDRRRLEALCDRYPHALGRSEVSGLRAALEAELEAGRPVGERLGEFEATLREAQAEQVAEARVRYEWLLERARQLSASEKTAALAARLEIAGQTLVGGGLPGELAELEGVLSALEAEERAAKELRERQQRLKVALESLRSEAEVALSPYRDHAEVELFLVTLSDLPAQEDVLGRARGQLSALLTALAREREEEGLARMSLRAAVQALPSLEPLEAGKQAVLQRLEAPGSREALAELEAYVQALTERARALVSARLEALEARVERLESTLKESLGEVRAALAESRRELAQGRFSDPTPIEEALEELVSARRAAIAEELSRYEVAGRSLWGLGGEDLEAKVTQARAQLAAGELPDLGEIHALLARMRRAQEALRAELGGRISALLESFEGHKGVGGETVFRLKPLCDFLRSASERLTRLGTNSLLEVRRTLEEAERLEGQLAQEYRAASSVMQELQGMDLDSFLDVFNAPSKPDQPPASPGSPEPPSAALSAELQAALASLQMRGVEAVALLEGERLLWGSLPIPSEGAGRVFEGLRRLGGELSSQAAQLAVLSLTQAVVVLLPLGAKGLVVLAEKALLSRVLIQIEKQREVLAGH
ncbi:MAG: hypothetical protein K6T57_11190 [Thermaceae bacterium]|nr:hypothetical protein [Thermaceae bacterium]